MGWTRSSFASAYPPTARPPWPQSGSRAEGGHERRRPRNDGRQLQEINLIEPAPGKTVDDVVKWYEQPSGLPSMTALGGVAVKPGEEASPPSS